MSTILTINDSDFTGINSAADQAAYYSRTAVRAVVFDRDGKVALMHASARKYYKLPGGGVDDGEDVMTALARELQEELGCAADVTHQLGTVFETRHFQKMTQTSHCYIATVTGDKGSPAFTKEELAEGFEVVWCDTIESALRTLHTQQPVSDGLEIRFMQRRDAAILKSAQKAL